MLTLLLVLAAAPPKATVADEWMKKAAKYPVGTKVKTKVESVMEHGVFVELEPEVFALVHKSDLPFDKKPSDYHVGDPIEVTVMTVDAFKHRIGAKVEQVWEGALKYPPGQRARGKVDSIDPSGFGVFVEFSRGYVALVHKSELPAGVTPDQYKVGKEVEVQVLSIRLREAAHLGEDAQPALISRA